MTEINPKLSQIMNIPTTTKLESDLKSALIQALLSHLAIGESSPLSPPDATVCHHISRGAIHRLLQRLDLNT